MQSALHGLYGKCLITPHGAFITLSNSCLCGISLVWHFTGIIRRWIVSPPAALHHLDIHVSNLLSWDPTYLARPTTDRAISKAIYYCSSYQTQRNPVTSIFLQNNIIRIATQPETSCIAPLSRTGSNSAALFDDTSMMPAFVPRSLVPNLGYPSDIAPSPSQLGYHIVQ